MTKRPSITAAMKLEVLRECAAAVACRDCYRVWPIADMQFDHWLALVDGGKHEVANLRPLCRDCHAKKSAREHVANSKAKRLAKAQEAHGAVVARVMPKQPGKIRNRGFDKTLSKKFSGEVVKR